MNLNKFTEFKTFEQKKYNYDFLDQKLIKH